LREKEFQQTSGAMRREIANAHSGVVTRLVRACALGLVTQYSRDSSDRTEKPRRTGYPAFAGYDDRVRHCDLHVIASAAKQSIISLCRKVD